MKKYNLAEIMRNSWKAFRTGKIATFAEALRMAWRNAKTIAKAREAAAANEEVHTWYGWHELGFEVIHKSTALFKTVVEDLRTKSGYRTLCYFGASQVTDQPQDEAV